MVMIYMCFPLTINLMDLNVAQRGKKSIMWLLESRWLCIPGIHIICLSILVALWIVAV